MIDHLRLVPIHIVISDNATVNDLFRAFTTFKEAMQALAPLMPGSVSDGYTA